MQAVFFDQRLTPNALNGTRVRNAADLNAILDSVASDDSFLCTLQGENGMDLLLGIGPSRGCVQYSRNDGEPPYLVAMAGEPYAEEPIEFWVGNELTPIPRNRSLPMSEVKRIATYFIETGERSPNVVWEEV